MADEDFFKRPRLFVDAPLGDGVDVTLSTDQAHYFKTVLRRNDGDRVRLFNGRDGEWICTLADLSKRGGIARPEKQLRTQPETNHPIHLFFAPIKKSRMDWLIEKAVELGATHLHPVITQNTEVRDMNAKRVAQQVHEAAEQCERLDIPTLFDPIKLAQIEDHLPSEVPMMACLERGNDTVPLADWPGRVKGPVAFLIGPEGGFTADESVWIQAHKNWTAINLGPRILRCESAVCVALSRILQ